MFKLKYTSSCANISLASASSPDVLPGILLLFSYSILIALIANIKYNICVHQ